MYAADSLFDSSSMVLNQNRGPGRASDGEKEEVSSFLPAESWEVNEDGLHLSERRNVPEPSMPGQP